MSLKIKILKTMDLDLWEHLMASRDKLLDALPNFRCMATNCSSIVWNTYVEHDCARSLWPSEFPSTSPYTFQIPKSVNSLSLWIKP